MENNQGRLGKEPIADGYMMLIKASVVADGEKAQIQHLQILPGTTTMQWERWVAATIYGLLS